MALRLVTAIARERARRPFACVLMLVLVAVMRLGPALAEEAAEAFSATVKVDATADSAGAAREAARIDGQRRALGAVIERLSGSAEAKPPKLDDKTITDMVDSFEVANERMSAVRYVADYTFHFRPSKVRRLVRVTEPAPTESGGKSTAEATGKSSAESGNRPIVVLPVYKDGAAVVLWDDPNAWRTAWGQRSAGSGSARLILPLGDARDLAAIDADQAESGQSQALTSIAQRNGSSEAVVALATARRQAGQLAGLVVSLKRYRSGRLVDTQGKSLDADPGESETDFLRRAADTVAAEIESGSKMQTGARSDQQASLAVTVPITSLGEWLQVRNRLTSVAVIRKVDLLSLSRQEARIEVKYVGSQDQLKSSLAAVDLDLGGGDPLWRIQPSGATNPR
jgi:Uncharacterized protein conserved in bacteria (DUF2066)